MLIIEATVVSPEERITYADVDPWDDTREAAIRRVLDSLVRWSAMTAAIQFAHAGRKASTEGFRGRTVPDRAGPAQRLDQRRAYRTDRR